MQNLTMWTGSVIDKFMELVLIPMIIEKKPLHFEQLAEEAVKMAQGQFRFSKNKWYEDGSQKMGELDAIFCILDIHEINKSHTEEEVAKAYNTIRESVLNIPNIRMPDGKILIDFLREANGLTPNVNNRLVTIEKAIVRPQIDLVAMYNWKPVILDWKVSASYTSDYSRQLVICGIIVYLKRLETIEKKPYRYEDITLFEVNLLKGKVKQHAFTEDVVNDMIDYINLTSSDILLLDGQGIDSNGIDNYEMTEDDGHCATCNHQILCSYLLTHNNQYDETSYAEFIQSKQSV